MLVILYGTSCSGKSEIIRKLVSDYNFKIIMCYHTREPRENDLARESISDEKFKRWVSKGVLGFVNEQLDARYGNKIRDFKNAVESDKFYVLDWPLSKREKLSGFEHYKIIVLPENREQLIYQIRKAGRNSRMSEILKDFDENYSKEKLEKLGENDYSIIINKFENLNYAVKKINKIIENGDI